MIKKYNKNNIYIGLIEDFGNIISMENIDGCPSITSSDNAKYYRTLIYKDRAQYIDIFNKERKINLEMKIPTTIMPSVSNDNHIYTICEETLVNYKSIDEKK